jgi:hypothetical protein
MVEAAPNPDGGDPAVVPREAEQAPIQPVDDGPITPEWCRTLQRELRKASWIGVGACRRALPPQQLMRLLRQAGDALKAEPTLLEVGMALGHAGGRRSGQTRARRWARRLKPPGRVTTSSRSGGAAPSRFRRHTARAQVNPEEIGGCPVLVVGDTHGQYHDVLRL